MVLAGGTAALLGATAAVIRDGLFVGNYLVHDGVLSDIVMPGPRPDVLPAPAWALVVTLASAAGVVLVTATVPFLVAAAGRVRRRDLDGIDRVRATLIGTVVAYAVVSRGRHGLRHPDVRPVRASAGSAADRAPRHDPGRRARPDPRWWVAAGTTLVLVGAVGLAFTIDSASFDGARWRAAERATRAGWRPGQIAGGFEWVDYHARTKVGRGDRPGDRRACVTVHVEPHVDRRLVVAAATSSAATRRTMRIVAYRTDAPCPTPARP